MENQPSELYQAIDAFIQTTTMEEAIEIIEQHQELLTDNADILFSTIISNARTQGHENTAKALDERRDFIRSIREEKTSL
ncbi:hypothetical protein QUF74_07715 [Candidatus Halobeggiatoa sp. HSG11]|nr:hypothetical protein [Candidatus Halobeggiatoa sp. HSG11]